MYSCSTLALSVFLTEVSWDAQSDAKRGQKRSPARLYLWPQEAEGLCTLLKLEFVIRVLRNIRNKTRDQTEELFFRSDPTKCHQ